MNKARHEIIAKDRIFRDIESLGIYKSNDEEYDFVLKFIDNESKEIYKLHYKEQGQKSFHQLMGLIAFDDCKLALEKDNEFKISRLERLRK